MKLNGFASAGMKAPDGYLSLNTIVWSSGALTLSTMTKKATRALVVPSGGKMIFWKLATTSCAVKADPSWNFTPCLILNVYVLPPSVGVGIAVQRSHTKSVGDDGLSGLTRMSTL